MKTVIAAIIGSTILATAALTLFRWEVVVSDGIVQLDRWSGTVTKCRERTGQTVDLLAAKYTGKATWTRLESLDCSPTSTLTFDRP